MSSNSIYTVYQITNIINGKIYIGVHKTSDIEDGYMGSGKRLKYAIQKYGLENFKKQILFVFNTPEEMFSKEAELVTEEFVKSEKTYNMKVGGFGGFDYINQNNLNRHLTYSKEHQSKAGKLGFKACLQKRIGLFSQETKLKSKLAMKQKYPNGTFHGKRHNKETLEKMKQSAKGKHSGEKNSQHGTFWITNGESNSKLQIGDTIPEGYWKGRTCC